LDVRFSMSTSFKPGDIYEDCGFHPCLCVTATESEVSGISLIDGSQPRSCDIGACGIRHLTIQEAWDIKLNGPKDPQARKSVAIERRWWREAIG
jgi:hypothetical protein